jgi:SAM-dependent methyltransferase
MNGWRMARCGGCHLVHTRAIPDAAEISEVYARAYRPGEMYDMHLQELRDMVRTGRARQGYYRNRVFLKRFKPRPGDRLLEVGCGIGAFLVAAHQRGWDVQGLDVSSEALAVSESIHRLPVRQGTLDAFDAPPGTFKAIVCWEVLEHLADPRGFLRRARSLLRTDGLLACSVPNLGPRVPSVPHERWGPTALPPVHLNFWDTGSFARFVEASGFRPLYLAPKRSLAGMAVFDKRPAAFLLNQLGALLHLREGAHIYAVLTPALEGSHAA